jgi:hypothetical protein
MKKTIGLVGGIVLSLFSMTLKAQETKPQETWDPKKNPTVDSITAPYKSMLVLSKPAPTTADIFPATGQFESATNAEAAHITITLDEQNKGVVWIEGLSQGKIKAMLRRSPATYKIPAQKTEEGKEVAEGTLIFDKETNILSICIGKTFDMENPATAFVPVTEDSAAVAKTAKTSKTKKQTVAKPWIYTGNKVVKETVMN